MTLNKSSQKIKLIKN
uniref:Uncharacterized protein n=1 Tax=Anguilla anguilla TaxID=7936 RepID=A0A0E9VIB8_ANGAN